MVAVIHGNSSLREALNYNENKVKRGVAECLDAGQYLKDVKDLTYHQKLARLQNRIELNERIKVNTLHISLNFAAADQLDADKLKEITAVYLDKIGFANQPYLLYEHRDAGHKHVHIVTTNIKADGGRISLHNIGKVRSEQARKEIESAYGLVRAEDHKRYVFELKPASLSPLQYGKAETKQAISAVLQSVINGYHFSSLPELNAILGQYRVMADPGSENSRIKQNQGLVYRVLDQKGDKIGTPIKASDFHFKPTLRRLQERFDDGKIARVKHANRLKNSIDAVLAQKPSSLMSLTGSLKSQGVALIARSSKQGQIYGLTYVDHRTKSVFNGSDLGKQYGAKAVLETLSNNIGDSPEWAVSQQTQRVKHWSVSKVTENDTIARAPFLPARDDDLLHALLQSEQQQTTGAWQLRRSRKKRKGKSI